jgi:hypothetical protein
MPLRLPADFSVSDRGIQVPVQGVVEEEGEGVEGLLGYLGLEVYLVLDGDQGEEEV